MDMAIGAHTTMSSSGAMMVLKRSSPSNLEKSDLAARWHRSRPFANSPRVSSGNILCVAHKATAPAPALEHSRLISPRWSSPEVKYV